MDKNRIVQRVQEFLKNRKIAFNDNSLEFIGLRKNYKIDEVPKNYYYLSYDIIADNKNQYSTMTYFIYLEAESLKISYIIGPQSFEKFE